MCWYSALLSHCSVKCIVWQFLLKVCDNLFPQKLFFAKREFFIFFDKTLLERNSWCFCCQMMGQSQVAFLFFAKLLNLSYETKLWVKVSDPQLILGLNFDWTIHNTLIFRFTVIHYFMLCNRCSLLLEQCGTECVWYTLELWKLFFPELCRCV